MLQGRPSYCSICKTSKYHLRNKDRNTKYLMKIPLKPWFTHLSNLNLTVVMILKMPLSVGYLSMNWFQLVLSTAARVVTCTRKCDQITPVLIRLHWLIVIFFKTLGPPLEFFGFNFLLLDRLPKALVQLFFVLLDLPVSTVTLNK